MAQTLKSRNSRPPWKIVISAKLASQCRAVANDVARSLIDGDLLKRNIEAIEELKEEVVWSAPGLTCGIAGLAVMCNILDACRAGNDFDGRCFEFLQWTADAVSESDSDTTLIDASLSDGLAGAALATWQASNRGRRYREFLSVLDEALHPMIQAQADNLRTANGVAVSQYDVISGLSGIGRYMLARSHNKAARLSLTHILGALISLSREKEGRLGFYTPYELLDPYARELYRTGYINCGLAHGVPGPLTLMALSLRGGIKTPQLAPAIKFLGEWLVNQAIEDQWGINWPTHIPIQDTAAEPDPVRPTRAAWCYGSPGVARTLWLAGEATANAKFKDVAVSAMEAVFRQPIAVRNIDSSAICHGVAGLLQITLRFAVDTGLPQFAVAAEELVQQLLDMYDPRCYWGYQQLLPNGHRIDDPSLLCGAAGIVLVLLSASYEVEPDWDQALLIS
ncbi:hypothetical protein BH10CYA1_BH10CYA1_03850 [soil metagenome]